MRHVGADIDRARQAFQRVEVFGEGFPIPLHPFGERGAGDVLHPFHQPDQPFVAVGRGGGKADTAVAHHHGGHAVPAGRGHFRIPRGLTVIMGVNIDPAGRDDFAARVNLAHGVPAHGADSGDQAVLHRDVAGKARGAGAIDNRAIADDQVISGHIELSRHGRL